MTFGLGKHLWTEFYRPDDSWAIHSHNDDAEQGGPEPDPEPDGEVGHPVGEAEVHQDFLEDEDRASAAKDCEGLPRKQAEDAPSQQMTQEWLQHALGCHRNSELLTFIWPEYHLKPVCDVSEETPEGYRLCDSG